MNISHLAHPPFILTTNQFLIFNSRLQGVYYLSPSEPVLTRTWSQAISYKLLYEINLDTIRNDAALVTLF